MIKTITGTIRLEDGTLEKVWLVDYTFPACGLAGHAQSLHTMKRAWENHLKVGCKPCREERGAKVNTDGKDARSLIHVHNGSES